MLRGVLHHTTAARHQNSHPGRAAHAGRKRQSRRRPTYPGHRLDRHGIRGPALRAVPFQYLQHNRNSLAEHVVPSPFYSYFFDSMTPYVNPGPASWTLDTYGKGLDTVPYPNNIVNDLKSARADLMNWYHKPGSPTDPADNTDPKYDYLSPMTSDYYLTQVRGFHPTGSDFYTQYAVDAFDGTTSQASADTSNNFTAAE